MEFLWKISQKHWLVPLPLWLASHPWSATADLMYVEIAGYQTYSISIILIIYFLFMINNLITKVLIHRGFQIQGRRHQRSKTEVSVAPRKGIVSSKNFQKKY